MAYPRRPPAAPLLIPSYIPLPVFKVYDASHIRNIKSTCGDTIGTSSFLLKRGFSWMYIGEIHRTSWSISALVTPATPSSIPVCLER